MFDDYIHVRIAVAKALDQSYEVRDLFLLMLGAFFSAFRWAGIQNLIQVNIPY